MSHYEFNKKIAMAWIKKDKYWLKTEKKEQVIILNNCVRAKHLFQWKIQ